MPRFFPINIQIQYKYQYKIRVYEIDRPQMEKPNFDNISTDVTFTAIEKQYAGDVLRQKVTMRNPFADKNSTGTQVVLHSGWNKMYIPQFQRMYKEWKEET